MANPKFLAVDLSTYTLTSNVAENASFPLVNLKTYFASDQWKSTSLLSQNIMIDFGSAVTCDTVVLQNHNMSSLNLTSANLQYSTDNQTWNNSGANLNIFTDPFWTEFTSQTARYWRINYIVFASTVVPVIGNWFLGQRLDFGYPYNLPFKNTNREYITTEKIALDGRIRTTQEYAGRIRWEFDWSYLPDTTRTAFKTVFQTTRGKLRPFYFLDTDGTTINYVHFDFDIDPSQFVRYNLNDIKKISLKSQLII